MTVQLRRILFPTDFSEPARQAQQYAMALADRFGAELHLLHVVPEIIRPLPDSSTSWTPPEVELKKHVAEANNHLLRGLGAEWAAQHVTARTTTFGSIVDEIIKYASEHDIDLIVLGTHGHTGLSRLLIGSVAEKVVRLAACPVLTIHPTGHQFVTDDGMNRAS